MMYKIKMLGIAVLAIVAVGAIAASTASALSFSVTKGEEPFTIEGPAQIVEFESGEGTGVECERVTGEGLIIDKSDSIYDVTITFHGCKEPLFNSPCESAGQPEGLIVMTGLDGELINLPAGQAGMRLLAKSGSPFAEFSCPLIGTVVMEGEVLSEYTGVEEVEEPSFEFAFRKGAGAGEQEFREYEVETGSGLISGVHLTATASSSLIYKGGEVNLQLKAAIVPTSPGEIII